jgi:cytochrome c oxidase assembly protein subunit 15
MERTAGPLKANVDSRPVDRSSGTNAVRIWLLVTALLVLLMVLLGGATRLTDSGLSITEWQPIMGAIPPLSDTQWQEAFTKYQQIPEYQQVNKGMSLGEFKTIYWWEWAHRFFGRLIGLVFAVPFVIFWLRGRLDRPLTLKLLAIFVLGALQGVMGWYMVMSGLVDRVDVSQYRLAAHLALAAAIFGAILWVVFGMGEGGAAADRRARQEALLYSAAGLSVLTFIQIVLGAFVAGMDAGLAYNTWPLMDGALVPEGLSVMEPWYINPFENALTVQFNHRLAAYLLTVWAVLHAIAAHRRGASEPVVQSALWLAIAVLVQVLFGIATLIWSVPLGMALAHQAGAFIVFGLALFHLHCLVAPGSASDRQTAAA